MCVSCGCGQVNDNHGDKRNITMDQVRAAAQAANTDEQTVARNIQQGVSQARAGGHGSSPRWAASKAWADRASAAASGASRPASRTLITRAADQNAGFRLGRFGGVAAPQPATMFLLGVSRRQASGVENLFDRCSINLPRQASAAARQWN